MKLFKVILRINFSMSKKVIIASKNPVKINAVEIGFGKTFSNNEFSFEGVSVPSGVGDQPMSDQETILGCLLYTSPSPRDQRGSRMPSSA